MSSLNPSYVGFIGSTKDALMVIQATLDKKLPSVSRRPLHREREQLIRLGHVFVFIEESSGIKRWTDGVPWSASRILGRFLVYRQLDTTSGRGKILKRKNSRSTLLSSDATEPKLAFRPKNQPVDDHALIKKTLSVSISDGDLKNQTVHLISYFCAHDVLSGNLIRPSHGGLDTPTILPELTKSITSLTLGGKMPVGDEAQYFLDSSCQLLDMLLMSVSNAGVRSDAMEGGTGRMLHQGQDLLNWHLQETAPSMHYLQPVSQVGLHNIVASNIPHLLEYPPPHFYPHIHQGLPLQMQTPQDLYKIQMAQQHTHSMAPPLPVPYHIHLQMPPNMMTDMHTHMQHMFAHNVDDSHFSAYSVTQPGSDTSSVPVNLTTTLAPTQQQNHQRAQGLPSYPWHQPQPAEYYSSDQYSERDPKEYYG